MVNGRRVLTAAHVVEGAVELRVRGPDKRAHPATVEAALPGSDLAIVTIDAGVAELQSMPVAAVDRSGAGSEVIERCHAVGYPQFKERPAGTSMTRDTAHVYGEIPVLSNLVSDLLTLHVSSSPRPLPEARVRLGESEWAGMSGAPVLAGGFLVGVVTEHAPREGASAITATPITRIEDARWWAALGVADPADLPQLPARRGGSEPDYWATVRAIRRRTPQLVGRDGWLAQLASFATGDESYCRLVGEPWAGKSALAAEVAVAAMPPEVEVVAYFLQGREADADSARFVHAVVPQLAYLLDLEPPLANVHSFRALWERVAERARIDHRHLLLVVDGLDEDLLPPGLPSIAALLPTDVGPHAHVCVTSRPVPLPPDVDPSHPLHRAAQQSLESSPSAVHQQELAQLEIERLRRDAPSAVVVDALGFLAAAAGPMAAEDLAELVQSDPGTMLELLARYAGRSVRGQRVFRFAHQSLLDACRGDPRLGDSKYRERLHAWAQRWRAAGWPGAPRYLLESYPATLADAPDRLAALATDVRWIAAAVERVSVEHALATVETAASAAALDTLRSQAHTLRPPLPAGQPGYVLAQICLGALELGHDALADAAREAVRSVAGVPIPLGTTRRALASLELGREDDVKSIVVLPDGRVVTCGDRLLLWDPAKPGREPIELGDGPRDIAALPDGRVVTGDEDGGILIWDPGDPGEPPRELARLEHAVGPLAVLADGRVVSSGLERADVAIWDPTRPDAGPVRLGRHVDRLSAIAVLADGKIVTGDIDGPELKIWDPPDPKTAPPILQGPHEHGTYLLAVLPDGRLISTGSWDKGQLVAWTVAGGDPKPEIIAPHEDGVDDVVVLADGRVVTGGYDGRILAWDLTAVPSDPVLVGRHDGPVWAVAGLPDGRVISSGDHRLVIWTTAAHDRARGDVDKIRNQRGGLSVRGLSDGRIVSGGDDGRLRIWDAADLRRGPVARLRRRSQQGLGIRHGLVRSMDVLPDDRLVTIDWKRIWIWDPATPKRGPTTVGWHDDFDEFGFTMVRARSDGCVVSGERDRCRVVVWNPARGDGAHWSEHRRLDEKSSFPDVGWIGALAVLDDGWVAVGGSSLELCRPSRHRRRRRRSRTRVGSPDEAISAIATLTGRRLLTGGRDGEVLVWDLARPESPPRTVGSHESGVAEAAVLPDGRVVTGGYSDGIRIWDITREPAETYRIACSVRDLYAWQPQGSERVLLVASHASQGFSVWEIP